MTKNDLLELYELFNRYLSILSERYWTYKTIKLMLTFSINKKDSILNETILVEPEQEKMLTAENKEKVRLKLKQYVLNLPTTAVLSEWGDIKVISENKNLTEIQVTSKTSNNYLVFIKTITINNKVVHIHKVQLVNKNFKKPTTEFIDIVEGNDYTIFTRLIKNQLIVYDNNKTVYIQNKLNVPYFKKLEKCESYIPQILTMDLETKEIDGTMVAYCASIYDGEEAFSFYITDYNSSKEMLKASIEFLLKRKYHGHIIYIHNFSYFDAIFMLTVLSDLLCEYKINLEPLIRDGRIINLRVNYGKDAKGRFKYHINFRDSYLLLTASLKNLGKSFSCLRQLIQNKKRKKVIFHIDL